MRGVAGARYPNGAGPGVGKGAGDTAATIGTAVRVTIALPHVQCIRWL